MKSDLYRELLPSILSQHVELLDHPRCLVQLCSLERRTARGGKDSIDHPPGGHDDLVNVIAGVVDMLGKRAPLEFYGGGDVKEKTTDEIQAEQEQREKELRRQAEQDVMEAIRTEGAFWPGEVSDLSSIDLLSRISGRRD